MQDDLATIAENKLDSLLAADEGNTPPAGDDGQQPPAGDDNQPPAGDDPDNNPNGDGEDPDDNQNGQDDDDSQNQPPQGGEEDASKGEKPTDDAGKPQGNETPKELSDDELLAELEKRGLKVAKKDEEQQKPQAPLEIKKPEEIPENTWNEMPPANRLIYSKLPYVTVSGTDAEGNEITLNVKTYKQLPAGFKHKDAQTAEEFADAMRNQDRIATEMHNRIQQTSQQAQQQAAQQKENEAIIQGIEQLQKDGVVPTITAKPGTPEFDKDPGVIRANQILQYREEILKKGEYISVVTAGKAFKADNPDLYVTKPVVSPADQERKSKSKNINGGGRGTQQQASKSEQATARKKYPIGMSATDIADIAGADLD